MKIRLNQNQVGRFNMLGNEESLAFSMTIVDDENNVIKLGDTKCIIRYSTEEYPESASDELGELFEDGEIHEIVAKCMENARSRDLEEAKAFMTTYINNYDDIRENFNAQAKAKLQEQIADLQTKLDNVGIASDYYEFADEFKVMAEKSRQKAEQYRRWQSDYKEESARYSEYEVDANKAMSNAEQLDAEYAALYEKCEAQYAKDHQS